MSKVVDMGSTKQDGLFEPSDYINLNFMEFDSGSEPSLLDQLDAAAVHAAQSIRDRIDGEAQLVEDLDDLAAKIKECAGPDDKSLQHALKIVSEIKGRIQATEPSLLFRVGDARNWAAHAFERLQKAQPEPADEQQAA